MPCNSEYMEASYDEKESREVCKHIIYLYGKLGIPIPKSVRNASESYYGDARRLGDYEKALMNKLQDMSEKEIDSIVYNAKSREARALANWYEDVMESLQDEVKRARRESELKKKAESLLSKMRAEEVEILKNYLKDN